MLFKYKPADGDSQEWVIDFGKMRSMEAEAIERQTGMAFRTSFLQSLERGSMLATRALLWTMLRRVHPTLKFPDVDFAVEEVEIVPDRAELLEAREKALADESMEEAYRAQVLAEIDKRLAEAPEPEGKASSPSESAGTSSQ